MTRWFERLAGTDQLAHEQQLLREEQLRLQLARHVWAMDVYLSSIAMPEDELVTAVMPTRNRAQLVTLAVNSVLQQSYRRLELVVVNDGSTDDTAAVLASIDDGRLRVVNEQHRGQAIARNAALDLASGEYVVYLDDDNLMHAHWMRAVVWAFRRHPEVDVVLGAYLHDNIAGLPYLHVLNVLDRGALLERNQADMMQQAHRRTVTERFDPDDQPFEDWGFLVRLTRGHEPLCLPALAGVYTTTAADRRMETPTVTEREEAVRAKLRAEADV
jgi:glycosyltransferase involved in cell wall biosynthesis